MLWFSMQLKNGNCSVTLYASEDLKCDFSVNAFFCTYPLFSSMSEVLIDAGVES